MTRRRQLPPVRPRTGKMGRPSAYTDDVVRTICSAYATGVSLADASRAAGISYTTAKAWAKESRENPCGPKGDFGPMLRDALSKSIVTAAHQKRTTDPGWFLARMRPRRFGDPTKRLELTGKVDVTAGFRHGQFEADIERILKLKPHKEFACEPAESDEEGDPRD
jgi:hypothetical protein